MIKETFIMELYKIIDDSDIGISEIETKNYYIEVTSTVTNIV